jgi:hypothetical protein
LPARKGRHYDVEYEKDNEVEGKFLVKKFIIYFIAYLLLLISAMMFFTACGYYLLIFDWQQGVLRAILHVLLLVGCIALAMCIYATGEKIKKRC